MTRLLPIALLLSLAGCGFERETNEDYESELADSISDSLRSVSDASDTAPLLASAAGGADLCEGVVSQIQRGAVCAQPDFYNSHALVTWSCIGPDGNGASGTTDISTVMTPDACPLVTPDFTIAQDLQVDRLWTLNRLRADLQGSATVTWEDPFGDAETRTKKVSLLGIEHRLARADELLRHQVISTVAPLDVVHIDAAVGQSRVVSGDLTVDFLLADVHAEITKNGITYRRGCCHPVAGSIDYVLSGESRRQGTIEFGPACGEARTDDRRELELAPCVGD